MVGRLYCFLDSAVVIDCPWHHEDCILNDLNRSLTSKAKRYGMWEGYGWRRNYIRFIDVTVALINLYSKLRYKHSSSYFENWTVNHLIIVCGELFILRMLEMLIKLKWHLSVIATYTKDTCGYCSGMLLSDATSHHKWQFVGEDRCPRVKLISSLKSKSMNHDI